MIRYLQRLRAKKGFTVVELIVVVAIIAVLLAVILSNIGSDSEKKQAACNYATDFYSAVQYSFTKYMKYEADLSADVKADAASQAIISYDQKRGGNYPKNKYTYIQMYIDNNQIKYVHAKNSFEVMLNETSEACITAFDRWLMKDIGMLMEASVDGYYYALVQYSDAGKNPDESTASVKVHSAYYSARDISPVTGDKDDFVTNNLRFDDYCDLANGNICGVCTSAQTPDPSGGDSVPIGSEGSHFMNIKKSPTADVLEPVA